MNNGIHMAPAGPDASPVNRANLVKGYEFKKDRCAIVILEELSAIRLETNDDLNIELFVDAAAIDPVAAFDGLEESDPRRRRSPRASPSGPAVTTAKGRRSRWPFGSEACGVGKSCQIDEREGDDAKRHTHPQGVADPQGPFPVTPDSRIIVAAQCIAGTSLKTHGALLTSYQG